jgi:16S rRNA (uracil1498-N3)-methyltransferase
MHWNLRRDTDGAIRNLTASPVNLILFQPEEAGRTLPRDDRRARHLLDVLRREVGDSFDAGVVNGPRGKGVVTAIDADTVSFTFTPGPVPSPLPSLTLLVGLPRPQTARDILRDATTLGATQLLFVRTEKSEPSYATSSLWSDGEWQRHVLAGAEQAFDTRVPAVTAGPTLAAALATLPANGSRLALDNYESPSPLGSAIPSLPLTVAIGGERGWSARDRNELRTAGFQFVHLGERVLRTETAVVAALAILSGKIGRS